MSHLHHCLPRELVDIIFDTLEDDKATLSACTLLSKYWHLPARQVLFRRIPLQWYHETYHANGFLALLNDKTSYMQNLIPCIKELNISCRITERIYEISVTSRGSISAYDVDLLLVQLPAVRLVMLTNAKLRHCEEHLTPRCWTSPRPLEELHLVNVYFAMYHQGDYKYLRGCNLVEVLNLFGSVGALEIFLTSTQMDIGVFFPVEKQVAAEVKEGQRTSKDFRVQKLVSSCYHNREGELFSDQATILNILKNSHALGALQSLSLNDTYESSKETIIAVGPNLKHLTLGLNLPYSLDDVLGTHSSPSVRLQTFVGIASSNVLYSRSLNCGVFRAVRLSLACNWSYTSLGEPTKLLDTGIVRSRCSWTLSPKPLLASRTLL